MLRSNTVTESFNNYVISAILYHIVCKFRVIVLKFAENVSVLSEGHVEEHIIASCGI
jgi:hypothetical protein